VSWPLAVECFVDMKDHMITREFRLLETTQRCDGIRLGYSFGHQTPKSLDRQMPDPAGF